VQPPDAFVAEIASSQPIAIRTDRHAENKAAGVGDFFDFFAVRGDLIDLPRFSTSEQTPIWMHGHALRMIQTFTKNGRTRQGKRHSSISFRDGEAPLGRYRIPIRALRIA